MNAMKVRPIILILFFIIPFVTYAQISEGGIPYTFNMVKFKSGGISPKISMNQTILGPVDNDREHFITDSINYSSTQKTAYYGKLMDVDIQLNADVQPIETDEGRIYLHHIISPGAFGLQFYFDRFKLPEGSKLYIYNEDKSMVLGAFTAENNNRYAKFGTQYIAGGSVFLEYYEPFGVPFKAQLHLNRAGHVFKPIFRVRDAWNGNGSNEYNFCMVDVACEPDENWRNMAQSVAEILCVNSETQYSYWCSGVLLNNTANDGRPLFLSANHCADSSRTIEGYDTIQFNYNEWIFLFNYQKKNCNDESAATYNSSIYGSRILTRDSAKVVRWYTDHLLLDLGLDDDYSKVKEALKNYNAVYAGWDANEDAAWNSTYTKSVHHPLGDPKKISTAGMVSEGNSNPYPGTQWAVTWNQGVTNFGSSGGPLFNDDFKVIGQLYGGGSMCSNPEAPDHYGRLSLSYEVWNLGKWLDPVQKNSRSAEKLDFENVSLKEVGNLNVYYDNATKEMSIVIMENLFVSPRIFVSVSNSIGQEVYSNTFQGLSRMQFYCPLIKGIYLVRVEYKSPPSSVKILVTE